MLDGPVARHTHTQSSAGIRLDSLADLAFTGVCLFRLLPLLHPPRWLTGWIAGILILRLCNLGTGLLRHKRLMLLHTRANKLTGLLLFGAGIPANHPPHMPAPHPLWCVPGPPPHPSRRGICSAGEKPGNQLRHLSGASPPH